MYIHVWSMYKTCMYYSIVHTRLIHASDMYVHVYARWVGFQMEALFQLRRQQIQERTVGPVAGSSRSTYGCGATEERFHGMWLWQTLWPSGSNELSNPGHGGLPPFSVGASRPPARNSIGVTVTVMSVIMMLEVLSRWYQWLGYRIQSAVISGHPISHPILTPI